MDLKQHLKNYLFENRRVLNKVLNDTNDSLNHIDELDINNAVYSVQLISLWEAEGEKSVSIERESSLESVIREAECQFKSINNRSDVQASYHVFIKVGRIYYSVPNDIYKSKNKF